MSAAGRDRGKLLSALQHAFPHSERGELLRTTAFHLLEHGRQQMQGADINYSDLMSRAGQRLLEWWRERKGPHASLDENIVHMLRADPSGCFAIAYSNDNCTMTVTLLTSRLLQAAQAAQAHRSAGHSRSPPPANLPPPYIPTPGGSFPAPLTPPHHHQTVPAPSPFGRAPHLTSAYGALADTTALGEVLRLQLMANVLWPQDYKQMQAQQQSLQAVELGEDPAALPSGLSTSDALVVLRRATAQNLAATLAAVPAGAVPFSRRISSLVSTLQKEHPLAWSTGLSAASGDPDQLVSMICRDAMDSMQRSWLAKEGGMLQSGQVELKPDVLEERVLQIASEEIFDESDLDALAASGEDTAGVQSRLLALALIIWGRVGKAMWPPSPPPPPNSPAASPLHMDPSSCAIKALAVYHLGGPGGLVSPTGQALACMLPQLGSAFNARARGAWEAALPGVQGSRMRALFEADPCFRLDPCKGNLLLVLLPAELKRMAQAVVGGQVVPYKPLSPQPPHPQPPLTQPHPQQQPAVLHVRQLEQQQQQQQQQRQMLQVKQLEQQQLHTQPPLPTAFPRTPPDAAAAAVTRTMGPGTMPLANKSPYVPAPPFAPIPSIYQPAMAMQHPPLAQPPKFLPQQQQQQQQPLMNGGIPGLTQGARCQPPSSYPSMPFPVPVPPPPTVQQTPPPPSPIRDLPTVPRTQAQPSPGAQPMAEFDDSEEERLALITAAFAVWPPAQGPDTIVKLAVALAILTPPPNVTHQHGLVRHSASRRFASKAACFARTKLPGEHFEREHMVAGPSTLMHSQVQALLSSDPFYLLESANVNGTLTRDNDVRLDSALLAAAACKLADSSSSSNGADADDVPSTSTMYPPLEWPLTGTSVSLLPSDALHFQAQPLTYRLLATMANGPQASNPMLQSCLDVLRTRSTGVTPDRAHNALASAVSLAAGEAPRLPPRWRYHLKVTAEKANSALLSSPPPSGKQPPGAANAAGAAGSGSTALAGGSDGRGGTVSEEVIKAQAVLKSDADGAALVAACLCAWPYPACATTTFSKLALALAIITQPPNIIVLNKGRHRGNLDFVLKIIHRTLIHAPAHQGGSYKAMAAARGPRGAEAVLDSGFPLLEQQVDQDGLPKVVLQLPRLAAIACAAAGSTAASSIAGRVPWPPAVEGLSKHLSLLHQQSQPLMEAFLTVMAAGGLPRAQLLRGCLKRLRGMAESVAHEDAQELQKTAAAAASPIPNTAFAPPGTNPLGGPRNVVILPPEPVKRQYISRKPEPKQEDPKEERERQRAIAAALKAQLKGSVSQAPVAAAAPTPSPSAWNLAQHAATKPAFQQAIPSASATAAPAYLAAPSPWQQQQQQQPTHFSPPFAVPEPVEDFKPVTNVDAYNALIAQYNAECGDSDEEDAERSRELEKDQDSLDVDQSVMIFTGDDGVTQFALYASGKIDQK